MFNQTLNKLLPPLHDDITRNNQLTDIWLRYFNNLYQVLLASLQNGIGVPSLTTAQRNNSPTYAQQIWLHITDAAAGKEMQINLNGTWYYATLTAV